jgi:heme A synthase
VAALFALSVSGMLVLHDGASNACPDWPICGWGGAPAGLVALQYLHRCLALAATMLIVAAAVRAWRSASAEPADRGLAGAALGLLAATAAAGAAVATTGAPPAWQAAHLAVASALWIVLVALATSRAARPSAAPGAAPAAQDRASSRG